MILTTNLAWWFLNSTIVAMNVVPLSLVLNSMAGYAFAHRTFKGRDALFILVLATIMIPHQVVMIPVFMIISTLHWVNSYQALILPIIASPFGIFLMRQYMSTIPRDLIDAARIDGAPEFRIYWSIVMPNCKPALGALGVFVFLDTWNNFTWPLIATTQDIHRTLPVGLATFQGQYLTNWGQVMAGATIMMVPVLVVFVLLQRYFIEGAVFSGMKG
jgi:ABC-type glycerol-3-phosphate transport system permease component